MVERKELSDFELIVLKGLSLGFSYKKISKELRVDENEVIEAIKSLIRKDYVKYHRRLFRDEFKLTKKSYEVLAQFNDVGIKKDIETKTAEKVSQSPDVAKRSSKLKKVIIAGIIIFFVFGVVLPRLPILFAATGVNSGVIKPLKIEVASFYPERVTITGLEGSIYLKVYNPNPIPATVDRITYSIYNENGDLLTQGEIPRTYTVSPESAITIQNRISLDWIGALHIAKEKIESWLTGKKPVWRVEGVVHVNIGITTLEIPFMTHFSP